MNACWLETRGLELVEGGLTIVAALDLKLGAGRTAIIGPNGAGKSTLLRLLHGLLKPSRGEMRWARPLTQGMVFQHPIMLRATALANVEYGLSLRGMRRGDSRQRALQALDRVGLGGLATRQARKLSGGEQQRIALARVWALEPELLFLDEPTASLDPTSCRAVERIILDIAAGGTRVVMTTHNLGQARRMAEEVIYLENGRALEQTPVAEFFRQPRTRAASDFIRDSAG